MLWPQCLKGRIKTEVSLAKYTTFKTGGRARFYLEPQNPPQLKQAVVFAEKAKIPVYLIGAGSNVLISDHGLKGLVIRLAGAGFKKIDLRGDVICAGAGLNLSRLVNFAKDNCLGGVEFLTGIPGTLGGAIAGNAGAWGRSISDILEEARVMEYNGEIKSLKKSKAGFGYRYSSLGRYIILSVKLRLLFSDKAEIIRRIKKYLLARAGSQEAHYPNAGCVFKNPQGASAGRLIDLCGLKGLGAGGARVSQKHANFIVNYKQAKSADILKLMRIVRRRVKDKFKINLQPEIKLWL